MNDKQLILNTLENATEPMNGASIAKATGIDKKIVSDIIKDLKKEGSVCSPKRCCYAINK